MIIVAVAVAVAVAAMLGGATPAASAFGKGFWSLIPFTMQMVFVVIGGYVVASSPPAVRLIEWMARRPKTGRGAICQVALFSMLATLLNWDFSLIFGGLLVRALARRRDLDMDYRAVAAAAYLGLGAVWAMGLSSSAAQLQANPASIPASLLKITGVIPFGEILFLWQSLVLTLVLLVVSMLIAYFSAPRGARALCASDLGIDVARSSTARAPGDVFGAARILRAVRRRQVGDRSAVRDAGRERPAISPRLVGADLQRRRSVAESHQSVLDVAATRRARLEGARYRRFHFPAIGHPFAAGAVPAAGARPDTDVSRAGVAELIQSCDTRDLSRSTR